MRSRGRSGGFLDVVDRVVQLLRSLFVFLLIIFLKMGQSTVEIAYLHPEELALYTA